MPPADAERETYAPKHEWFCPDAEPVGRLPRLAHAIDQWLRRHRLRGRTTPAIAPWQYATALACGPDGAIFVASGFEERVWRLLPGGLIEHVAGTGRAGYSGDGGPAAAATLRQPRSLAYDPHQRCLYVADAANCAIRKVDERGIISTVAGTGQPGCDGDGGPASAAQLGFPWAVAAGPDGALTILDGRRVRRIGLDGIIHTIALLPVGDGHGDRYRHLAVAPDGRVFVANRWQVSEVGAAGELRAAASIRDYHRHQDGTCIGGVALDPSGVVLATDEGQPRVFRGGGEQEGLPAAVPLEPHLPADDYRFPAPGLSPIACDSGGAAYVAPCRMAMRGEVLRVLRAGETALLAVPASSALVHPECLSSLFAPLHVLRRYSERLNKREGFENRPTEDTALHTAALLGDLGAATALLEAGADVAAAGHDGATPLHHAAFKGHLAIAELLLDHGAAVDVLGRSGGPLHAAVAGGRLETVRFLLAHGANPNAAGGYTNSPLYMAGRAGRDEIARALLDAGADPEGWHPHGETPLHAAAERGDAHLAALLLTCGATPVSRTDRLATPLHYAAAGGHVEAARELLAHGALVDAQDEDGHTPLDLATAGGHIEMVAALVARGQERAPGRRRSP